MMKRYLVYFVVAIIGLAGCNSESPNSNSATADEVLEDNGLEQEYAEIKFDSDVHSLGSIAEGEQLVTFFKYENTGNAPLLIHSIKAGCGCTVPQWNEEPLNPGESEKIKVIFNSEGKKGNQNIRITVSSNARNAVINLAIKGEVK